MQDLPGKSFDELTRGDIELMMGTMSQFLP